MLEHLPVALRSSLTHALATWSPAPGARHLRRGPALIQKDQPFDRYRGDLVPPRLPTLLRLFGVLFLGVEQLFLRRSPNWRTTTIQSQPTLKCRRCASSRPSCSSAKVISGWQRICSRNHLRTAAVTRLGRPPRQPGALISPVLVRRAEIFLAQPTLTLNRFATSSRVPSPLSYASNGKIIARPAAAPLTPFAHRCRTIDWGERSFAHPVFVVLATYRALMTSDSILI